LSSWARFEAVISKIQDRFDLFPCEAIVQLGDFVDCKTILEILENCGDRHSHGIPMHAPTLPGTLSTAGHFEQSNDIGAGFLILT